MQGSSELAAAAKDADLVKSPHVQVYMLALPPFPHFLSRKKLFQT
jgi:hypothetical protein